MAQRFDQTYVVDMQELGIKTKKEKLSFVINLCHYLKSLSKNSWNKFFNPQFFKVLNVISTHYQVF